ncbi:MAG: ABC transporter substrate-binding protein [Solirubrobacterales bacterium]
MASGNGRQRDESRSHSWWKGALAAALCLALAIAVTACGSSSDSSAAGGSGGGSPLVIAAPAVPTTLDMEYAQASESGMVYKNAYDSLFQFPITRNSEGVSTQDVSKEPTCLLCKSFSYDSSQPAWKVTLRPKVLSSAGNELTAEDVKWSWERSIGIGQSIGGLTAASVDTEDPITVTGKYTFTINLTEPNPLLPKVFAVPNLNAPTLDAVEVKKHATSSDPWAKSWLATHTAGFGPLEVESFTPGNQITWVRNPNYFGKPARSSEIIIKQVPESSTRTALLQSGSVDIALNLTPQEIKQVEGNSDVSVESVKSVRGIFFGLNTVQKPFDNVLVRQAIAYASPVEKMRKAVFLDDPNVRQTGGYLPENYPGALTDWPYKYDPTKAKELLKKAGVGDFSFKLTISSAEPVFEQMAIIEKSALAPLGITLEINKLPAARYQEEFFGRKAQSEFVEDQANIPDGPYALSLYFSSEEVGVADWTNYSNAKVDRLLAEGSRSTDPSTREQKATEAHKIIVSEVPWAFALFKSYDFAQRSDVHGFVWKIDSLLWLYPLYKS